jgi:DNA polymerase elongation subunit (family B)
VGLLTTVAGVWGADVMRATLTLIQVQSEVELLTAVAEVVQQVDADVIVCWDARKASLGFLIERADALGVQVARILNHPLPIPLLLLMQLGCTPLTLTLTLTLALTLTLTQPPLIRQLGRTPHHKSANEEREDQWGSLVASGIRIIGRIVLNLWRCARSELQLTSFTIENVAAKVRSTARTPTPTPTRTPTLIIPIENVAAKVQSPTHTPTLINPIESVAAKVPHETVSHAVFSHHAP